MSRNNAAMERDLRHVWRELVGRSTLAEVLAPDGISKLIVQCRRMLNFDPSQPTWPSLAEERRRIARAVLDAAEKANQARNQMVHRTWYAVPEADRWTRAGFTNNGGIHDSVAAQEVRESVDQALHAALRVGFLAEALLSLTFERLGLQPGLEQVPTADTAPPDLWAAADGGYHINSAGFVAFGNG